MRLPSYIGGALNRRRALERARRAEPPDVHLAKPDHLADRPLAWSPHNAVTRVDDWRVDCVPPRRKVLIYGAGLGKDQAPLEDPTWVAWALNLVPPLDAQDRVRADVWWDLHQRVAQTADDLRWIARCPVPIYLPDDLLGASVRAVRYPILEVEAAFGSYFSCTFAYQIALALFMGDVTDLGLYGVELAWGTERERTVEWACVAYWLGRAEERGLRIHLPSQSLLGRHLGRYGLDYERERDAVDAYVGYLRQSVPLHDVAGTSDGGAA